MTSNVLKQKETILQFFEGHADDYWKTIDEIAAGTNLNAATIAEIVTSSGDFVRSSYRVKLGEPLYTSRVVFRDKAPLVDKVLGAFKNRID